MAFQTYVLIAALALPLAAQEALAPPMPMAPPEVIRIAGSGSYLGVGVREVDSERARTLKLAGEYGVEITKVDPDSPAEKAGLKVGDVVQSYNKQRVEGTEQFVRMVRETPSGREVQLGVVREGSQQSLTAAIGARKASSVFSGAPMEGLKWNDRSFEFVVPDVPRAMMSWRSAMLGVEAESIGDSQLASFFGVKEGVLVRGVLKDTAAEKADIKPGDVLLKVEDEKVSSPRDVTAAIRTARKAGKKSVNVTLVRERREMSLPVTLDEETSAAPRAPRSIRITKKEQM